LADTKISALPAIASIALEDLLAIVDDPSGTPVTTKGTFTQVMTLIASAVMTMTNKTFDADGTGNSITNIENADIKAAAAIAHSKMAALTASRAMVTDGSGFSSASSVTSTELGYVSGVTSAIQTQLAARVSLTGAETVDAKTMTNVTLVYPINAQTGTSFTPDINDAREIVTLSNASAIAVTIPPNSSVAYAVGSQLTFIQIGAGQVTINQGSGVTIGSTGATPTAPVLRAQYSSCTAIKTATDTWIVVGDIE